MYVQWKSETSTAGDVTNQEAINTRALETGVSFCLSAALCVCVFVLVLVAKRVFLPALATSRAGIHTLYAWFVWERSMRHADCPHCDLLPMRTLRSRKALFEEGAFKSVPRGSGPASAEAERALHSWGSQLDLLEGMETGVPLSSASPSRSAARSAGSEARTAVSSPRGSGSTVRLSSSEGAEVEIVEETPQSVQYEELLEVVTRAVEKLKIDWPTESQAEPQRSRLDERFLQSRPPSARRSLPFFPDLHTEVSRSWNSPFSARLFIPASYNYGSVAGLDERGYRAMPRVEQTLASYLSPGSASSLKAPALPTKPLRVTSALVGKGYTAAGQAGACLHTMSVLQAYQADLLKELDEGEEIKDADIAEVRRTADLALRATKETARAIGRSIAALVAVERHLWLTLSDMKETDRVFLLDAPLSPSGLFGDSVNSVVDRYQEARKQAAAFQRFLPLRHPAREAAGREQPRPSTSSSYRDAQKQSVATRTPPHREQVVVRSKSGTSRARPDLRETVLLTLPVLQGAAASSEHTPRFLPPGNVAGPGGSPPPRGFQGPLVQVLPAGEPLQDTVLVTQQTPETSLERLVPLVDHLAAWKLLPNVSAWVLRTVERGYRIQFGAPPPPFVGVSPTLVGPEQGLVMEQEVVSLLRKEAIEVVPPHDRESGFYSRYFIVPKKDGGLRPILDLRVLNRSVMKLKFRMLTLKQVVSQIRSEDWFVTIDLKDAYFHVSILPQHRKFLRFAFRGEAYQYRVLPFGLALSPRTFTKCVDAALAPLRLQGIRILNYIDDWLILAQSEQLAAQHRDVVLAHMKELGLRLNAKKKNHLSRCGMGFDHDAGTVVSCSDRVDPRCSQESQSRPVTHCQAVSTTAGSDGGCVQRDTFWPAVHETPTVVAQNQGVLPEEKPLRMIKVTRRCLRALDMWRNPWFLSQGPVLGAPCRRVTLATDASLTGWGAVMSGHTARGLWRGHQLTWHINCLEMLAVFQALKHFLPDLRDRHVLVRTDNTAVVSYINHQGGLRSRPLYKLAHQILVWSRGKLLSLRAVYLPGYLNVGADILSRQGPRPGGMDASPRGVHPAPLGLDAMVQTWPRLRLYAFPPDRSAPGSSRESAPGRGVPPPSSPILAGPSMVLGPDFSPRRLSTGDSRQEGSPLTGGGLCVPPSPGAVETLGVAPEGAHLLASGLSTEVVETILQSRAPSTRKLYALKWRLFTSWCERHQQDPVNCPVGTVLEFLQDRLSAGLSHSTLKVYVAAIAAYHAPLGGLSVGKDPLVSRFLHGALRLRPPVRSRVPSWDLSLVLEALCRPPFEPIEEISDRHLTIKTVLLIAITSLKRVGDLQALSVAPSFLDFAPGLAKPFLHPRPGYIPKVHSSAPRPVVLQAFCPPPFREPDQQKLNCMCPVRALDTYVHRAAMWRKSDQLFVCYGPAKRGFPATKQTLSRWIVDAISTAYESSGLPTPLGVKAHSTRSVSASKAFLEGVPIQDICNAAGWSTPLTFAGTWLLAAWASRSPSVSTRLEFLKGNVSGYVCNPGSPRERDAASRGPHPASLRLTPVSNARVFIASWLVTSPAVDVSLFHWTDYTCDSEHGHAEGVPPSVSTRRLVPSANQVRSPPELQPVMNCINMRPFPLFWAEYWTVFSTLCVLAPALDLSPIMDITLCLVVWTLLTTRMNSSLPIWITRFPRPLDNVRS
ncbi:Transposon Ty3-G Gag-Pol polyprotein [Labeo rohita]|uniref:ribonuclease H n=1 Tax=Labeo rohita TaxID=84645 RepID=A0ABQ8LY62_LABRO|nr:Transposon Ty3-G Gag-Pol polyprotein [Labeo rohita]